MKGDRRDGPPTHAGGVVVRRGPEGPLYLLVGARRDPSRWVLPKGHVEPGETTEQAAAREIREEAGVEAEVVAALGRGDFAQPSEPVRVIYYLLTHQRDVPGAEDRRVAWVPFEEARRRLGFPEARAVLDRAHAVVSGSAGHEDH